MTTRSTYRSAEWKGTGFRVDELPLSEPGPGEIQVDVAACGVCLTEVHHIDGYYDTFTIPGRMGHEFGGRVTAVGPGVDGFTVGMSVGAIGAFGGFGETVVALAEKFLPIPDTLPIQHSCFVEPVSCCVKAVRRARIPIGATVVVTGAGSNGLLTLQLVRRCGAARTIVSEPDAGRREVAGRLGADDVVDPTATPLKTALDGVRIDVAIDTSGHPAAVRDCLDVVTRPGRVVMFGVSSAAARLELPLLSFHMRDTELVASMGADPEDPPIAAALLPSLELEPLISHRFSLDDVAKAFDVARGGKGLKAVVVPGAPDA